MSKANQVLQEKLDIKAWKISELGFDVKKSQDGLMGHLCDDSRDIQAGNTFICLPRTGGQSSDFIAQAIQQGATAVVMVGDVMACDVPIVCLQDMQALGQFLRRYFGTLETATQCIGITGTDGKTSVAWMLRQALQRHLGEAWSSGTLGWMLSTEEAYDLGNTTPSLLTMHHLLAAAHQANVPAWVMEVSSHGIEQQRMAGIPLHAAVWTTLGHDHLQDHGGFENYANLKAGFVNQVMEKGGLAVVNAHQSALLERLSTPKWKGYMPLTGQCQKTAMMQWKIMSAGHLTLQCQGEQVHVNDVPVGQFHAENLAAVAQVLKQQWKMRLSDIATCLHRMPSPFGRMEAIKNSQGLQVYVDYAHTPEGLQACLQSARALTKGQLKLVFGCGGNRDVSKRADMGRVAAKYADKVWLTSDNPRDEKPEHIIADILEGLSPQKVKILVNRGDAIVDALASMKQDDVLVIAGKGHEDYMEIKGKRAAWHDATWVRKYLKNSLGTIDLTGKKLATATDGVWHGGEPDMVHHITTDSRNFQQDSVFLALRGVFFDGHQFAASLSHQALALVGDSQGVTAWDDLDVPYLEVSDTLQAYGAIAHAWREKLSHTSVIGITGSYGKTTVRSMLAHLLTGLGLKVHATHANLNNLIGVPQTLLAIPMDADVALIECGISEQGEMQRLADILSPDGVVMTGITSAHAEGLGGLQGVVQEKSRLLSAVKKDGWCALGKGVATQLEKQNIPMACQVVNHGVTWTLQSLEVTFHHQGVSASLRLSLPAQHWCDNMALVLSIALAKPWQANIPADFQEMVSILATWQAVEGRLRQYEGISGCQILDDAYNANPVSMQAALNTLRAMPARRIAILGDMKELGEDSAAAHATIDVKNIECVWLVGEDMRALHQQCSSSVWFSNVVDLLAWLLVNVENVTRGDTVLVKGSHSMGLEKVVKILKMKDIDCAI